MPRPPFLVLIAIIAVTLFAAPTLGVTPALVVTTIDGEQTTGELKAWQSDGLTLEGEGGTTEVPAERLLSIRRVEPLEQAADLEAYVELVDGSLLPLRAYTSTDHEATIDTPLAPEPLTLSTDEVHVVQFARRAKENSVFWSELAEGRLSGDTLVVQQNDEGQVEHLSGVLGDVSAEQVQFNWDGQDIPVKRTKVVALAYYHSKAAELPAASCRLVTVKGARLPLADVAWNTSSGTLQLTTVGGVKLVVPLEDLIEADYSLGKLSYLSDLEPLKVEWTPRIDLPTTVELIRDYGLPRRDQSFAGSLLSLLWPAKGTVGPGELKTYTKGLAVRSRTVLDYRIPEGMNRLVTLAGIDPATAGQGNVSLEISADDRVLWQGEIDGRKPPVEIDVPLPQARRLRIVVDYGGNLDYGDRLHLVEARLTK